MIKDRIICNKTQYLLIQQISGIQKAEDNTKSTEALKNWKETTQNLKDCFLITLSKYYNY